TRRSSDLRLATVSTAMGRPTARRDYLRRAAEHSQRRSERQRLLLTALLARNQGNPVEAARAIDNVIAKFPDLVEVYRLGSSLYRPIVGELAGVGKQLALAKAGGTALPLSTSTRNIYGYALLNAGRYADALAEFE